MEHLGTYPCLRTTLPQTSWLIMTVALRFPSCSVLKSRPGTQPEHPECDGACTGDVARFLKHHDLVSAASVPGTNSTPRGGQNPRVPPGPGIEPTTPGSASRPLNRFARASLSCLYKVSETVNSVSTHACCDVKALLCLDTLYIRSHVFRQQQQRQRQQQHQGGGLFLEPTCQWRYTCSHNVQWLHWLPLALMVTDEMYGSGRPLLAHGNNPAAL